MGLKEGLILRSICYNLANETIYCPIHALQRPFRISSIIKTLFWTPWEKGELFVSLWIWLLHMYVCIHTHMNQTPLYISGELWPTKCQCAWMSPPTKGRREEVKEFFLCHPDPPKIHKKQEKPFLQEIWGDMAGEAGLLGCPCSEVGHTLWEQLAFCWSTA